MPAKRISKKYFFFAIIWMMTFMVLGIESGEGTEPTADSNPLLDTIYILSSPIVLPMLYYQLYNRVNIWFVMLTTPLLGIVMEWLLFRPADVLNESTPLEATLFFAFIWAVILVPPYFLTRLADRSRNHFVIVLSFVCIAFVSSIVSLIH